MPLVLLAATDDRDPLRRDEHDSYDDAGEVSHRATDADADSGPPPSLDPAARDLTADETVADETVADETVADETVALVPATAQPEIPTAPISVARPALRDEVPVTDEAQDEPESRSLVQRAVLAVLLIAAAALIGYALSRPSSPDPSNPDVIARSVDAARGLQFMLDTTEPTAARQFVRTEFGWRVGVPVFAEVSLRGIAVASVARDVEVPVFLYADPEDREVAVFVYSYALLDQIPDRLTLARSDFDDLALGEPVRRPVGATDALLWRDRDDIYIAVSSLDAAALIRGLTMAR